MGCSKAVLDEISCSSKTFLFCRIPLNGLELKAVHFLIFLKTSFSRCVVLRNPKIFLVGETDSRRHQGESNSVRVSGRAYSTG